MSLAEPIAITLALARVLDKLGIRYLVGGSLASSVHGIPRSTQDIDLLVELPGSRVDALVQELEHIIVQKLDWFEKGSRISERQWNDVVGVLKVRGATLDLAYLHRWADELGVAELLAAALREAGL